jgi:hypothetical protein
VLLWCQLATLGSLCCFACAHLATLLLKEAATMLLLSSSSSSSLCSLSSIYWTDRNISGRSSSTSSSFGC